MESFDRHGQPTVSSDAIAEMFHPVKCLRCGHIHDGGKVTVIQRYLDCSTWRCPNCRAMLDDRPRGWGGSSVPVNSDGTEK